MRKDVPHAEKFGSMHGAMSVSDEKLDRVPERPTQPRTLRNWDSCLDSPAESEDCSQPVTDDAFQTWMLSLFDDEIDEICGPTPFNKREKPLVEWTPPADGNFSRTSRAYSVDSEGILRAECHMVNGEYYDSAIDLNSILMGLNGEFKWLDGSIRSPSCQNSDASEWHLLSRDEVDANAPHPKEINFPVIARCMNQENQYQAWYLELDERIANDKSDGRLKLVTPLGLLNIPSFTDYHISTVAIGMVKGIRHQGSTVQSEDIELRVQNFVQSRCFVQTLKQPLAECLYAKAAALTSLMWIRFCRTYAVADLIIYRNICKAIDDRLRELPSPNHELKVLLEHYQRWPSHLQARALSLIHRAGDTRHKSLINEGIDLLQMLLEIFAEDNVWKPLFGQNLCQMILMRYHAASKREDLQQACTLAETFCTTHFGDDGRKASALLIFAECKIEVDSLSGDRNNRGAIVHALKEVELCGTGPEQHESRRRQCYYYIENLSTLETFDQAELDRNVKLLDVVTTSFIAKDEEVPSLEEIVGWRFKAQGLSFAFQANPQNSLLIDEAIRCAEKSCSAYKTAEAIYALSDFILALSLTAQAKALAYRFQISEASDDLSRIIEIYQEALAIFTWPSKRRKDVLHGLALHQLLWHNRKGALVIHGEVKSSADQLLIDAFQNAEGAYQLSLQYGDPYGLFAYSFLRAWELRFGASGDWAFLDTAIQIAGASHSKLLDKNRGSQLLEATKCRLLFQRYLLRQSPDLYSEAMNAARQHSQRDFLKTIDGPHMAIEIMNIATEAFKMRVNLRQEIPSGDVDFVKQQCDQIFNLDRAQLRDRIEAGIILGLLNSISQEWGEADRSYRLSISLFKRLITRSLSRADREWLLKRFSKSLPTRASFAALYAAKATGLSAEQVALSTLQRLESSRGMLASLVLQSRLNLDIFRSEDSNAAKEYDSLLRKLTSLEAVASIDVKVISSSSDDMMETDMIQQRGEIVKRLSELEDKLEAKTEAITVDALKSLVGKAAFVHIMAMYGSTIALLVTGTGVRMVELKNLKAFDIEKNLDRLYGRSRLSKVEPCKVAKAGQELGEILKWLWDTAVKPILSELGYYPTQRRYGNRLPRLWWCASDITSKLPFHAAGEGTESVNSENVYDYAVCSVTVSLTVLKMARGFTTPSKEILDNGILAVSMPTTPKPPSRLPLKAEAEVKSIKDAGGPIKTNLINPKKEDVIEKLSEHGLIHFICHGTSNAEDPSSSALVLGEQNARAPEYLTVKELGNIDFGKARIAYLSACSTAENSSFKLSDESIHLASACQLAGFPHVIAAFWEVKDRGAIALAGLFYQNLATAITDSNNFESNHDIVAYALHNALCKVRQNKGSRNPLCWAPFVHIGA